MENLQWFPASKSVSLKGTFSAMWKYWTAARMNFQKILKTYLLQAMHVPVFNVFNVFTLCLLLRNLSCIFSYFLCFFWHLDQDPYLELSQLVARCFHIKWKPNQSYKVTLSGLFGSGFRPDVRQNFFFFFCMWTFWTDFNWLTGSP